MPRQLPDHNGLKVLECAAESRPFESTHPDEIALYQLVTKKDTALAAVADAYEIYISDEFRHSLNALLLANATDEQICPVLEVSQMTIRAYRYLFFDRSVFRHVFDIRAYVRELPIRTDWKTLYVEGIERGTEALLNRFRVGTRPQVEPRKVLEELMNDQFDRSKAHRGMNLTEEVAKQALNWGRAAVSTAQILLTNTPQTEKSAMEEVRMQLITKEHTQTLTELNISVEDLVH